MVTIPIPPNHFISPSSLPSTSYNLSILTYNVLLPNSQDGWWNYKMYSYPESMTKETLKKQNQKLDQISNWSYRQELLKERIRTINSDVVCVQEVSPLSFEDDFAFMKDELGYDGMEIFKRGRFRPATFWRSKKCELVAPPTHKDRTLLTTFRLTQPPPFPTASNTVDNNDSDSNSPLNEAFKRNWHVLNCHLQAGSEGRRRVRQIDEGVKACFNLAKKLKENDPTNPLLIVCGDFNGGSECGALRYLENGTIGPDFIEDGEPVAGKVKINPLCKPLNDAAASITSRQPPSTLVVPELISQMVKKGTEAYGNPELTQDVLDRLKRIYIKLATYPRKESSDDKDKVMSCADVEKWLIDINRQVGRGTEFRNAAKEMGWIQPPTTTTKSNDESAKQSKKVRIELPKNGILTVQGFINVYNAELNGGKFWGIAHDLAVLGEALPNVGTFEARFDRIYHTDSLYPTTLLDTVSTMPCPSETEPSDHLPVAASFSLRGN